MPEEHQIFEHVRGARIEVWLRLDGAYGVTIVPDAGGSHSFISTEEHVGFPDVYDSRALLAWARKHWRRKRPDG